MSSPSSGKPQGEEVPTQQTHEAQSEVQNSLVQEKVENGIATLTLNRPDKLNALNRDLSVSLNEALERVQVNKHVRVVILTGMGRAFCAGGDLGLIGEGRRTRDTTELEPLLRSGMQAVLKIHTMRQPVIAMVNGPAAGAGLNLALAADMRIASDNATFGENFAKVGLFPDYGGTYFLPLLVGPAKAAELFYTGDMIDAQTALQLGLVNRVVPSGDLEKTVMELAGKIAQGPPVAIKAIKQAVFGHDRDRLAKVLENEVEQQLKCFHSEDCSEGIRAFFEKRKPQFKGE